MKLTNHRMPIEQRAAIYLKKHPNYFEGGKKPPLSDRLFKPRTVAAACTAAHYDKMLNATKEELAKANKLASLNSEQDLILNSAHDIIDIVEIPSGITLRASNSYNTKLGYNIDEDILGKSTFDQIHPHDLPLAKEMFEHGMAKGEAKCELRIGKKDGSYLWMEVKGNIILDAHGKPAFGIIVSRDIDELKRAQDSLMQNEEMFRKIFTESPIAIIVYDKEGKAMSSNQACEGFGVDFMKAVKNFNLFEDPNITDEMKEKLKADGRITYEMKFNKKDPMHLRVSIAKVEGANGLGHILQAVDITKDVENNANKNRFFGIIAHDLRGPFNSILGLLDVLKEDQHNMASDERQRLINGVYKSSQGVYQLLVQLLEWSRLYSGQMDGKATNITVHSAVDTAISPLIQAAAKKQITISNQTQFAATSGPANRQGIQFVAVSAQEVLFERVIANLVSNSIKFTPNNGRGHILISAEKLGDIVKITIADNGVGISDDIKSRMFEDNTITTPGTDGEKGTGLGLPMVKTMVEKMGGDIWVETKTGKGSYTKFIFTLPSAKE